MRTIENIKTGEKYSISEKAYKKLMSNKSLRSRFHIHPEPEVPEEVSKAIEKEAAQVEPIPADIPIPTEPEGIPVNEATQAESEEEEKPKRSRRKKQQDDESNS